MNVLLVQRAAHWAGRADAAERGADAQRAAGCSRPPGGRVRLADQRACLQPRYAIRRVASCGVGDELPGLFWGERFGAQQSERADVACDTCGTGAADRVRAAAVRHD